MQTKNKTFLFNYCRANVTYLGRCVNSIHFSKDSVYWSQRVNNGFVREPMNNFTASLYEPYLASLEGLDKCGSYTLKESLVRRDEAIITLECDGKIKFAQGTMDR